MKMTIQCILSSLLLCVSAQTSDGQSCMSYSSITLINATAGFDWDGPYAEFAIPHSALTSSAGVSGTNLIGSGGAALCNTAPIYVSIPCSASVAAELSWLEGSDKGFGVFAFFHWAGWLGGLWTFSSATSICPATGPVGLTLPGQTGPEGAGDSCNINSDCQSGMCMQAACNNKSSFCQQHACLCPFAQCLGNTPTFNIKTPAGTFLTAVLGGGVGGPNSGPNAAAIHTDAKTIGAWETFTCVTQAPNTISFQTNDGHFITAVNGGGIAGPDADPYELITAATQPGAWEQFTVVTNGSNQCALQTFDGNLVTAVNGGGWGSTDAANQFPIHTNATQSGQWETFTLVPATQSQSPGSSAAGCPGNGVCCGSLDPHGQCAGVCTAANTSCSTVKGYQCGLNQQCCGTVDSHGICSGRCGAPNASCTP
jgi:hypothetical protein